MNCKTEGVSTIRPPSFPTLCFLTWVSPSCFLRFCSRRSKKMKIFVKTLKGTHFDIDVKPDDTVADVKKLIETVHGPDVYPSAQQMLIHQGKVLKDPTTMSENNVLENSFLVIMLSKPKNTSSGALTTATATTSQAQPPSSIPPASLTASATSHTPLTMALAPASVSPAMDAIAAPTPATSSESDMYGQATLASNLVAGSNSEEVIQHILDIGGGIWDRETVIRALHAAYNNPERAVEYLYSGIPVHAEVPPVARAPSGEQSVTFIPPHPTQTGAAAAFPSTGPNANPLNLFPQGLPDVSSNVGTGTLDILRNSPQFQALQAMVQANPQILEPMLQELGNQNPHLRRLIQEHQSDFLHLLNETVEGAVEGGTESDILGQSAIPQSVTVTPAEREAIERLEAMGFDRALVLEVFFACNKNEELAANYLLDHMHEFED